LPTRAIYESHPWNGIDDEDLTTKEEQPINTQNTIEELKSKLNSIETGEHRFC
jgi:hypothetical protein